MASNNQKDLRNCTLLAWVLMIALLGGALFIYLNYMQEEIEIISQDSYGVEDIRG